jgi:tetratricopeptide (TPR) repeat protein
LLKSAEGWRALKAGDAGSAVVALIAAADEEDALEKLPLTPGPIVPAREQLGELLLQLNRPKEALAAFEAALALAPGRRNAIQGASTASAAVGGR